MTDIPALIERANDTASRYMNGAGGGNDCARVLAECAEALSRLSAFPRPEDRVKEATKLLVERIPLILDFGDKAVSFYLMAGVVDLARDVLTLAAPDSPLPEEIAGLAQELLDYAASTEGHNKPHFNGRQLIRKAAAALQQQAREIGQLREWLSQVQGLADDLRAELESEARHATAQIRELRQAAEARLPTDIAEISRWLDNKADLFDETGIEDNKFRRAARAFNGLAARSRELEAERDRLQSHKDDLTKMVQSLRDLEDNECSLCEPLGEAFKKLEAERDALMKRVADFDADRSETLMTAQSLEQEQIDAIRAKTRKECAEICDGLAEAADAAEAIRALNRPSEA